MHLNQKTIRKMYADSAHNGLFHKTLQTRIHVRNEELMKMQTMRN